MSENSKCKILVEVRCCDNHDENAKLIWTFAFPGAEYWCPYCGQTFGMLGAGEYRKLTFTERREQVKYKKEGVAYLEAKEILNAEKVKWKDNWIHPSELPKEEKERLKKIVDNWVYPIERN